MKEVLSGGRIFLHKCLRQQGEMMRCWKRVLLVETVWKDEGVLWNCAKTRERMREKYENARK